MARGFIDQAVPAAFAGIPDFGLSPRLKQRMPALSTVLAVLFFWMMYWLLPRSGSIVRQMSAFGPQRVLSALVLGAAAHQLSYMFVARLPAWLRIAGGLAAGCAAAYLYPPAATAAAWTALIIVCALIAGARFAVPGAILDHPMDGYLTALQGSKATCGELAPRVYKSLGLDRLLDERS
jgi:peptidoglycan/LPS O-acetylase OafA/YrhL